MGFFDSIISGVGSFLGGIGDSVMGAIDAVVDTGGSILKDVANTFGMGDLFGGTTDVSVAGYGYGGLDTIMSGIDQATSDFLGITPEMSGYGTDIMGFTNTNTFLDSALDVADNAVSATSSLATPVSASKSIMDKVFDFAATPQGGKFLANLGIATALGGYKYIMDSQQAKEVAKEKEKDREMYRELEKMKEKSAIEQLREKEKLEEQLNEAKKIQKFNVPNVVPILPGGGQIVSAPTQSALIPQVNLNPNPTVNTNI